MDTTTLEVENLTVITPLQCTLATANYMLHTRGMGYLLAHGNGVLSSVSPMGDTRERLVAGNDNQIMAWVGAFAAGMGGWAFVNIAGIKAATVRGGRIYIAIN